jgi:carbamoyltransferase
MLTCGLKLTHDGGLAVLADDELLLSVEMEKRDDNPRFQPLDELDLVADILAGEGIRLGDIDRFVVDGWFPAEGEPSPVLRVSSAGRPVRVPVAPYSEADAAPGTDPLHRYTFSGLPLGDAVVDYSSYHHAAQHIAGAYGTSPYAAEGVPALVLIWDGGLKPTLYHVAPGQARRLGTLMPVYGSAFADFAAECEPFRGTPRRTPAEEHAMPRNLDVAGKAMAYAALGRDEPDLHRVFDAELARRPLTFDTATDLARQMRTTRGGLSDADLIATFQSYLGARLIAGLERLIAEHAGAPRVLCMAGGCALNIKWNSAVRAAGVVDDVWVPPFPNDSGAALGAAFAERFHHGASALRWSVHRGPKVRTTPAPPGWHVRPCDAEELARLLYENGEPVVVLRDRAELGPRALGARSILATATDPKMKDTLNRIKDRESYRPVAPICLEDRAAEIFEPGCPDPYMLFDHRLRATWAERIPAVVHLDGTARLQTVSEHDDPFLTAVLRAYHRLSGVPVLCNTSANQRGRGFFPSVASAAAWGGTDFIWCDGQLYARRPS